MPCHCADICVRLLCNMLEAHDLQLCLQALETAFLGPSLLPTFETEALLSLACHNNARRPQGTAAASGISTLANLATASHLVPEKQSNWAQLTSVICCAVHSEVPCTDALQVSATLLIKILETCPVNLMSPEDECRLLLNV